MTDHNLDDLIIDTIEPNHSKTKSFLTIVALLIVFLIVGIILAKIYTTDSGNATLPIEENNTELIAPELKLQAPVKAPKVKEAPSLSNIIEEEIQAPEPIKKESIPLVKPKVPTIKKDPIKEAPEEIKKKTVEITQEFTQKPQVIEIPKVQEKEESIVVPKTVTPKNTARNNNYYIQVGSFSKIPSSRFLSVIKNAGFNYTITNANTKGIKKLLIGPYNSKASVDTALVRVKDRINKKAFVVKK